MENRIPLIQSGLEAKSSSGSNSLQGGNYSSSNNEAPPSNPNTTIEDQQPINQIAQQEEEQCSIPLANLMRIMRQVLPPHAKVSDGAKAAMRKCVHEFICFLTGEANERCHEEYRKVLTADDILCVMERLGFDDYVGPLSLYLQLYRQNEQVGNVGHVPLRQASMGYYRHSFPPANAQGQVQSEFDSRRVRDGSGASGSGNFVNKFDPDHKI